MTLEAVDEKMRSTLFVHASNVFLQLQSLAFTSTVDEDDDDDNEDGNYTLLRQSEMMPVTDRLSVDFRYDSECGCPPTRLLV